MFNFSTQSLKSVTTFVVHPITSSQLIDLIFYTDCVRFHGSALQRLPPLSTEPNRCERAYIGNTIGQANGVYDKPLDLRFCDYTNEKSNLKGKSLSAALMSDAKFDGADMSDVIMSKAYAVAASFKGTISFCFFFLFSKMSKWKGFLELRTSLIMVIFSSSSTYLSHW